MAELIPDKLPLRASVGEKKLFSVLQKLPDDYIVYYEPISQDQYPDFIIIGPDLGILVIEVQGWYLKNILEANNQLIRTKEGSCEHPTIKAREYMMSLVESCKNKDYGKILLEKDGENKNRFIFPFGHFAVLSNITGAQVQEHNLTEVFPPDKVVTRDILESWTSESLKTEDIYKIFLSFFKPFRQFTRLDKNEINAIRAIIHSEIILSTPKQARHKEEKFEIQDLKVLDTRQELNARKIGEGHRIIYGVAGSGKTVLLIAKARILSTEKPESKILLLCFNVTLASYLNELLTLYPNVTVKHFDGWAKANNCVRQYEESNEDLGKRFKERLTYMESERYDAILIDEAQDFATSWFECVLEAMNDPYDGDLVIVGDGSQGIYSGNKKIKWKDIGIKAVGRVEYTKFDLDKNYRNSREIIELASIFASQDKTDDGGENSIQSLFVDPKKCQRSNGIKPVLLKSGNREEESNKVIGIVKKLLNGFWFDQKIKPLNPENIGILYRLSSSREKVILKGFIEELGKIAPVLWINNPGNENRIKITKPGIKIQTIHSAKGLQYHAVILLWADQLPALFDNNSEESERRLMYVAMTRPEDFLVISTSGNSDFIQEIENSHKVDVKNSH